MPAYFKSVPTKERQISKDGTLPVCTNSPAKSSPSFGSLVPCDPNVVETIAGPTGRAVSEYVTHTNAIFLSGRTVKSAELSGYPYIVHSVVESPLHVVANNRHSQQVFSDQCFTLLAPDQEFCTCDSNSDDSHSLDINANVSAFCKSQDCPVFESCCFPKKIGMTFPHTLLSTPSPPPPHQPAPPVPIDIPSHEHLDHIEDIHSSPSTNGSTDYLEPQVISRGQSVPGIS
ncbi:hypothetical protein ElyMa_000372400 [Elysia marginata]|uniref:Uncharacterized protein n=1 Tax=Elysia marginata TaxID=1093978 RepID=A0AAV4FFJ1_9GAST|nr:hypothetical protein ElyMa_000372400 [Elysia marginata]